MARILKNKKGDAPGTVRYGAPKARKWVIPTGDAAIIGAIDKHIAKHVGKVDYVLHEIVSELVHIDVHVIKPTKKRSSWLLITSGMSELPMKTPRGAGKFKHAELAISLPGWWKLDQRSMRNEKWYWPIRWLKTLARFPHELETWLFYNHTVPLADAFPAPGTPFTGVLLGADSEFPSKFWEMKVGKRAVYFMTPIPVTEAEMNYRLEHGSEALLALFESVSEEHDFDCYDPKRPEVCPGASSKKAPTKKVPTKKRAKK